MRGTWSLRGKDGVTEVGSVRRRAVIYTSNRHRLMRPGVCRSVSSSSSSIFFMASPPVRCYYTAHTTATATATVAARRQKVFGRNVILRTCGNEERKFGPHARSALGEEFKRTSTA